MATRTRASLSSIVAAQASKENANKGKGTATISVKDAMTSTKKASPKVTKGGAAAAASHRTPTKTKAVNDTATTNGSKAVLQEINSNIATSQRSARKGSNTKKATKATTPTPTSTSTHTPTPTPVPVIATTSTPTTSNKRPLSATSAPVTATSGVSTSDGQIKRARVAVPTFPSSNSVTASLKSAETLALPPSNVCVQHLSLVAVIMYVCHIMMMVLNDK
jgi:hypothetical protein